MKAKLSHGHGGAGGIRTLVPRSAILVRAILVLAILALALPAPAGAIVAPSRALLDDVVAATDAVGMATAIVTLAREHGASAPGELLSFPGAGEALAQGDADGDGKDDVLLRVATSGRGGSMTTLRLVAGGGGERWSWSSDAQRVEVTPAVDLDGDGRTDVLITAATAGRDARDWTVHALRGHDGALLWERAVHGEDTVAGPATVSPAAFVLAIVGGDADGDGGADVWLERLDVLVAEVPGVAAAGAGALALEVLSGATGAPAWSASWPLGAGGAGIALPSGDLDGDGRADTLATLVPTRAAPVAGSVVEALDAGGRPLWALPYSAVAFAQPVRDLDGDARADALVSVAGAPERLELVSGATGLPAWTWLDPLFLVVVPGDVDGDGAADVMMMDGEQAPGATRVRTMALAGADGSALYDASPHSVPLPENGWSSIEFQVASGDLDGDGVLDTLLNVETGIGEELLTQETLTVAGATGAIGWTSPWGAPGIAIGDVTGDGADDVALRGAYGGIPSVWLVDGATGVSPWLVSFTNDAGVRALGVGDVDGDGRDDLLTVLHEPVETAPAADGKGGYDTRLVAWNAEGDVVWGS